MCRMGDAFCWRCFFLLGAGDDGELLGNLEFCGEPGGVAKRPSSRSLNRLMIFSRVVSAWKGTKRLKNQFDRETIL